MIKLRHFLVQKMYTIYYEMALIIETTQDDYHQSLLMIKRILQLANDFNHDLSESDASVSSDLQKYYVNTRPILAKIQTLTKVEDKLQKSVDLESARLIFNET